jgi:Glycosyl transferase family 2
VAQGSEGGGCTSRGGASDETRSDPAKDEKLEVSVVVCAYTQRRWVQTRAAIDSVLGQRPPPAQVLLVVDHNAALAARARRELTGITVVESDAQPGLSGARNTGLSAATQPITAFLDDDAEAQPGWLASLVQPYSSADVVATGGSVHPVWPDFRPRWLPPAFDWVVGCSYLGLPDSLGKVRNPIGANMSMRTHLALEVGGFDATVGRVGSRPKGCEETELAIRLTASRPGSFVLYVPTAPVDHHVAPERVRVSYFLRRCWHEGLSKSVVVRLAGSSAGLQRERRHVAVVIPKSILRDLRGLAAGDSSASMRMVVALSGLAATFLGYLVGCARISAQRQLRNQPVTPPVSEAAQTLDFPADAL